MDHDLCFEAAGFDDFGDTGEEWFSEFETLVGGILSLLGRQGQPRLAEGEYPAQRGRARESLGDALVAAATDDNFRPCMVNFGEPVRALLWTSDGHPILWISLADGDAEEILAAAGDREIREKQLDWGKLL